MAGFFDSNIQTPIAIPSFNALIFVSINLLWISIIGVLCRLAFQLSASITVISGGAIQIDDSGFNPWSFTDGTRKMKAALVLYGFSFFISSMVLEFGFDGGTYFKYERRNTTELRRFLDDKGLSRVESSGFYIANTNSCPKSMRGKIQVYNASGKATSTFISRRYDGSFSSFFPVTVVQSGEPFCTNRGVRVDGAAILFIGLKQDSSKKLFSTEEINPEFSQLPSRISGDVHAHEQRWRPIIEDLVDAGNTSRTIWHRPGLACKLVRNDRRLCLVKLRSRFPVGSDQFTHVLAQEKLLNTSSWFVHALIKEPNRVRRFVDFGWYQSFSGGSSFEVDRMVLALFLIDGPGLELGEKGRPPFFSVLHAIAHVLASGPDYEYSFRRLDSNFAGVPRRVRDKERSEIGATISHAGLLALGMHFALLLMSTGISIFLLIKRMEQKRTEGDNFPLLAIRVSRAWYNSIMLASIRNFVEPLGENCQLVLKLNERRNKILLVPAEP